MLSYLLNNVTYLVVYISVWSKMESRRLWTPEEDRIILESTKSVAELSGELGRTAQAIYNRRNLLRNPVERREQQKKSRKFRPDHLAARRFAYYSRRPQSLEHAGTRWTEYEDLAITAPDRPTDIQLSELLCRTLSAIHGRRSVLKKAKLGEG